MRFHWLLPSVLGIAGTVLLSSPADAARLQFWRFNASENRLEFTTDAGVQPRAQLIPNPTRLVIDLPGTTLGRPMVNQSVGGEIREVRVGQFDAQTARIVIELNPGYTIDPQQVRVRGATPTQWTVQLPDPERVASSAPVATPSPSAPESFTPESSGTGTPPVAVTGAATQLENVRITPDGFFIRTRGAAPEIELRRSRDRQQVSFDLENTGISPQLTQRDQEINQLGVSRLQITQAETSPPVARITLDLENEGVEWQATASNLGGIVIVPTGGRSTEAIAQRDDDNEDEEEQPATAQPATISSVELTSDGTQLVIGADRALSADSGWDRETAAYQITLRSARLAREVTGPQLGEGSPLLRVRLRQDDEDTVVILVQPAAGVQVGNLNELNGQTLALELQRAAQPVPVTPPPRQAAPPALPPRTTPPPVASPRLPNSRVVIVVDPGHGGPDPGAIGINGLREKDIVLPISLQVAAILEQQGVQVVLTRRDDRDLDLEPRVQLAERSNANLFVSIHANAISLSRPDVNGAETYYYSNNGLRLAQVIHRNIIQMTGMQDRGVRQARFYVLRNTSMPAVLVETGFVTGRDDAARLSSAAFQSQMAAAIAQGILQYVQQNL